MSEISKEVVLLIIADLERQLASSAENSVAGRMIVQQAVCAAFAERYLENSKHGCANAQCSDHWSQQRHLEQ